MPVRRPSLAPGNYMTQLQDPKKRACQASEYLLRYSFIIPKTNYHFFLDLGGSISISVHTLCWPRCIPHYYFPKEGDAHTSETAFIYA